MTGRVADNLLVLELDEYGKVREIPHAGGTHVTKAFALLLEERIDRLNAYVDSIEEQRGRFGEQ